VTELGIGTIAEETDSVGGFSYRNNLPTVSERIGSFESDDEESVRHKSTRGVANLAGSAYDADEVPPKVKTVSSSKFRKQNIAAQRATPNPMQFESQLFEIHDVCKAIVEKFIAEGAPCQINIAYKMRIETENVFRDWSFVINEIRDKLSVERESVALEELEVSYAKAKAIFEKPKKEVYELMQKDTYSRLKLTKEFKEFLEEMKPISSHEKSAPSQSFAGFNSVYSVSSRHEILVDRAKRRLELHKNESKKLK